MHVLPSFVPNLMISDLGMSDHYEAMDSLRALVRRYKPKILIYKTWLYHANIPGYRILDAFKPIGSRENNSEFYALATPHPDYNNHNKQIVFALANCGITWSIGTFTNLYEIPRGDVAKKIDLSFDFDAN